jgi:hypothetical protein
LKLTRVEVRCGDDLNVSWRGISWPPRLGCSLWFRFRPAARRGVDPRLVRVGDVAALKSTRSPPMPRAMLRSISD